jgi:hypothetical protein
MLTDSKILDAVDYESLFYPFPQEIHPEAAAANQHMLQWATGFRLIPNQYTLNTTLQRMNYGWLGARVHPRASIEALRLATEWQCWLFFGDDENDESDEGQKPAEMALRHAGYLAILDGKMPTRAARPTALALTELRSRLARLASPECRRRFRQRVEDYFSAIRWEAENRLTKFVPDPETYVRMRLDTSAVYTCFELIEFTEGISLPKEVRDHPQILALGRMANNVTSWCNDVVSLDKELRHGDVHNLVIVLRHHHKLSLLEAVHKAIELHNAEVNAYLELEKQLPTFGPQIDEQVQRYLSGLRSWMRGNFDWGLNTKRYKISRATPQVK